MHIAIAGGHSALAPGASGYLDEYECDRAFTARLIEAFDNQGWAVTDCSNEEGDERNELRAECRLANESGADLFIAVHFNAGGGTGTEVWHYPYSSAETYAWDVSRELASALGLPNRGAKSTTGLYVINHTDMPAILIEVCFVDTEADAEAWHATSWNALCGAVVRGLGGDYRNKEEDMLTEYQDKLLATIYEQVTGTYDPTGRGVELNDHDHIKWLGKAVADNAAAIQAVDAKLDKLIEKLG
jgi:N-acetylmuramoyl-L-alanine amidase